MCNNTYINSYISNSLVDEFMSKPFSYHYDNVSSINDFLTFIKKEVVSLTTTTELMSYNNYFLPFKRAIKSLYFICNYCAKSNHFSNGYSFDKKDWEQLEDASFDIILEASYHENNINKCKDLYKNETISTRKAVLKVWLDNFFDEALSTKQKKEYNKLTKLLEKYVDECIDNNDKALWKGNYAIIIQKHQSYMLKGLESRHVAVGKRNAEKEGKDGWIFYTEEYTTLALLKSLSYRPLRKRIFDSHHKLNSHYRVHNNNDVLLKNILSIRQKIAHIYGKSNYADLVLSNYVMNTTEQVYDYLDNIQKTLSPEVEKLYAEIEQMASKDGIKKVKNYDIPYYLNKIEQKYVAQLSIEEKFDNYFIFENVLKKFINYLKKEFNLHIQEMRRENINNLPENLLITYKLEDVETGHSGYLMLSPFDNKKKINSSQTELCGNDKIAHNTYMPSVEYIQLQLEHKAIQKMQLSEVTILLHEFGHALHSFYANKNDSFLNESLVSWDLVELPSQFLENLVYDINFMQKMSCHYQTSKKITKNNLLKNIEAEQYLKVHETYVDVKRFYINLWLNENYNARSKKLRQKSLQETLMSYVGENGLVYNLMTDVRILPTRHMSDYAASSYIYLYSGNIAHKLSQGSQKNIKNVFTNLFNSGNIGKMESRLLKNVDVENINIFEYLKKGLDINIYGDVRN